MYWTELKRGLINATAALVMVAFAIASGQTLLAQGSSDKRRGSDRVLGANDKRVMFDGAAFSPGVAVPHWERGYLVSKNTEITGPGVWAVRLYDSSGTKVREVSIWFPGSQRVLANSAAVTPEGGVVVSGVAEKSDGTRAYYVASTDAAGKVTNVIQTNPYLAMQVCVAPDGTVWSFGGSGNQLREDLTFRHFDMKKGELGAYLPRSSFNSRYSPSANGMDGARVSMTCAGDHLAIFTEVADEFIEMDFSTQTIRRWQIDHSTYDLPLMGRLAVTSSGDVYAVLGRKPINPGLRGLFHLNRDAAAGKVCWLPVEGQTGNAWNLGMINDVFGADGDALVYAIRNDWPALKWARPVNK